MLLGGSCIKLLELDEQLAHVFVRNPDSRILYLQAEARTAFRLRSHDDATTLGGELQRIGDIVVENLLEAGGVEHHLNQAWVHVRLDSNRLRGDGGAKNPEDPGLSE